MVWNASASALAFGFSCKWEFSPIFRLCSLYILLVIFQVYQSRVILKGKYEHTQIQISVARRIRWTRLLSRGRSPAYLTRADRPTISPTCKECIRAAASHIRRRFARRLRVTPPIVQPAGRCIPGRLSHSLIIIRHRHGRSTKPKRPPRWLRASIYEHRRNFRVAACRNANL